MSENTTQPDVLALIPARGGSKGIPGKNIMQIAGRPLIAYSILQAQRSRHITRVIVSTDDDQIAAVSREWGAEVPFMRPDEFAQDLSPDIDVFRHALLWLKDQEDYTPEMVVQLRPPGPVRRVELIDEAVERLAAHPEADALRSVAMALQTPFKMWLMNDDGTMRPVLTQDGVPDSQSLPRQMLPPVYWQNGYVDVIRPRAVLDKNSMWGDTVIPFVINEPMFEIDYPENIPAVEAALQKIQEGLPLVPDAPSDRHPV